MKTQADHARAYRQRRADRIQRYEEALREIAEANEARPLPGSHARDIARQALAPTTSQERVR